MKMFPWQKEKPVSEGWWYPTDPEIDKVLRAWDIIHPASHAGLRMTVVKYLTLLETNAPNEESKMAKEECLYWWNEYQKDMEKRFPRAKGLLKY